MGPYHRECTERDNSVVHYGAKHVYSTVSSGISNDDDFCHR